MSSNPQTWPNPKYEGVDPKRMESNLESQTCCTRSIQFSGLAFKKSTDHHGVGQDWKIKPETRNPTAFDKTYGILTPWS